MKDIIVDPRDSNDLVVYNGDFYIESSEMQHVAHIVELDSGQSKQYPFLGAGIRRYLNGNFDANVKRKIQIQLQSDTPSIKVRKIGYTDGLLNIEI